MSKRRVVITGLGAVTPVGLNVEESWKNILAGNSGIATIDRIDTTGYSVTIGGSVRGFDVNEYISPKEARKMDAFIHYGMAAAKQAIGDSGIEVTDENAERIGVEARARADPFALLDQGEERALRQVLCLGACLAAEEAIDAKEVAAKKRIPGFAVAGLPRVE